MQVNFFNVLNKNSGHILQTAPLIILLIVNTTCLVRIN